MQEEEEDSSTSSTNGKWEVSHSVWPDLSQKGWANLAVDMASYPMDMVEEDGGSGGKGALKNSKVPVNPYELGILGAENRGDRFG